MEFRYDFDLTRPTNIFVYTLFDGREICWDVHTATACVMRLPSLCQHIPAEALHAIVARNRPFVHDWNAIDLAYPGIGAPMVVDGRQFYVLVDGNKRAAKTLRECRLSMPVMLLTPADSRASIVHCDDWSLLP